MDNGQAVDFNQDLKACPGCASTSDRTRAEVVITGLVDGEGERRGMPCLGVDLVAATCSHSQTRRQQHRIQRYDGPRLHVAVARIWPARLPKHSAPSLSEMRARDLSVCVYPCVCVFVCARQLPSAVGQFTLQRGARVVWARLWAGGH